MLRRPRFPAPVLLALLLLASGAPAEEVPEAWLAVVGARVLPVCGPPIADGTVLVRGGRIEAVGPRAAVAVPEGATVVDAAGLVACPGFVDARSGLFLDETETRRPSSLPDARAGDGADPFDGDAPAVLRAGVTTVFLMPASGPGVNGSGAARRAFAASAAGFAVPGESVVKASLGMTRRADPGPIARITEVDGILGALRAAEAVRQAREKYGKDRAAYEKALEAWRKKVGETKKGEEPPKEPEEPVPPRENPVADPLVPVLDRRGLLRVEARAAEDLLAALRILDDFPVRLVLEGGDEAGRVLPALAAAKAPVVLGPLLADDPADAVPAGLAKALRDAGVRFAIATFSDPGRGSRFLPLHAAAAVAAGLSREEALRAITLDAAVLSGVGARVGSLEPGKDADLVLLTGDPLDTRSRVVRVLVGGETAWEDRP